MDTNLGSNIMTYADIVQWAYGMESILKPDPPPTPSPNPATTTLGVLCVLVWKTSLKEYIHLGGLFLFNY